MATTKKSTGWFTRFARFTSKVSGNPLTFAAAVLLIIVWGTTGPMFGYSDTWQLVINTGTTIVTFLMVFLIQNTQNRDTVALQVKLDEIIRALEGAHNELLDLEELDDQQLESIAKNYRQLAADAREQLQHGQCDTDAPEVDANHETADAEAEKHHERLSE